MANYVTVADLDAIAEGASRIVFVRQKEIAIFRFDGKVYALDNLCPHRHAPLSAGSVADGVVVCPWHGARFELKTGRGLNGPHKTDIGCYPVQIDGKKIKLAVCDE